MANLLETLRSDAVSLAQSDLPSAEEIRPVLAALISHVEQLVAHDELAPVEPAPPAPVTPAAPAPVEPSPAVVDSPAAAADPAAADKAELKRLLVSVIEHL